MARLQTVSTASFKYDRFGKQFYATLSQLGCEGIDSNCAKFFGELKNGCGFILQSQTTGKPAIMKLVKTNKIPSDWHHEDFDVTSWIFKPIDIQHEFELKIIVNE